MAEMTSHYLGAQRETLGFTLLEVLLAITLIAILAGLVVSELRPAFRIASTRNLAREIDAGTIATAVHEYAIDHAQFPATITGVPAEICRTDAGTCAPPYVDLMTLKQGYYVTGIPIDPTGFSVQGTGYFIQLDDGGRVTVTAPHAELGEIISVSR